MSRLTRAFSKKKYIEKGQYEKITGHNKVEHIQTPIYSETKEPIRFNYHNGKGLTKELRKLYDEWVVSDGNYVIETNYKKDYDKNERIWINGNKNIISKTETFIDTESRKISRGKLKESYLLFIG